MSLLHLVHQSVVLHFTAAAQPKYDTTTGYVFRLTGVDGMGFLQLQDVRQGADLEHETIAEPYWINKDLVREIAEYASATEKDALKFSGESAKAKAPKPIDPVPREIAPKLTRSKTKLKQSVL